MRTALRATLCLGAVLAVVGCTMFRADIHVRRPDGAASFAAAEQDAAKRIVIGIGRPAGFAETATPDDLSADPSSPYHWFVSLESSDQESVDVSAGMRKDRREIRIVLSDYARGQPLPSTRTMIDELRTQLERAFPDCQVEVTRRNEPRLFGP